MWDNDEQAEQNWTASSAHAINDISRIGVRPHHHQRALCDHEHATDAEEKHNNPFTSVGRGFNHIPKSCDPVAELQYAIDNRENVHRDAPSHQSMLIKILGLIILVVSLENSNPITPDDHTGTFINWAAAAATNTITTITTTTTTTTAAAKDLLLVAVIVISDKKGRVFPSLSRLFSAGLLTIYLIHAAGRLSRNFGTTGKLSFNSLRKQVRKDGHDRGHDKTYSAKVYPDSPVAFHPLNRFYFQR
mmetsp:Transcript_39398/g.64123  ORF Transcript_39398/g.64123 Transcript_39398/m.64123 type:complete len:246 (+) Transcript_39398:181-918(+)